MYKVKILTPEFKERLDAYLRERAIEKVDKDGCTPERREALIRWDVLRHRETFNSMWNSPEKFTHIEGLEDYYKSVGLWTPEYTEHEFAPAEVGFQSQARIVWNGEIKKIDSIDEIFHYSEK